MRSFHLFSALTVVLSFGAVTFAANTAHAVPCCSAPMCQKEIPHPSCSRCSDECVEDEVAPAATEVVYDEVESICYMTGEVEPAADAEPAEHEPCEA